MQETQFQVAKTPGTCFFWGKKPPAGLHHTEVRTGDASTHYFDQNPDIQISKDPDFVLIPIGSTHFQPILIENQSNPIGINPKSEFHLRFYPPRWNE